MAVIETWYNQDLQQPVKVHYLDGSMFSHNGNGNRIGVHVFNNGEPVTLTGTVSGYVVTSDGATVPCTGSRSGNSASILIPAAAYQPGAVFITVFITDGTTVTTLASVSTSVLTARTNNQIDPGSVVTDWTQTINGAMQDVQTAADNLGGIVATPYASLTFPVPLGKYTYYEGNLYRCISPIATSESFTAAHWTQVRLGDDVSDLNSAVSGAESVLGITSVATVEGTVTQPNITLTQAHNTIKINGQSSSSLYCAIEGIPTKISGSSSAPLGFLAKAGYKYKLTVKYISGSHAGSGDLDVRVFVTDGNSQIFTIPSSGGEIIYTPDTDINLSIGVYVKYSVNVSDLIFQVWLVEEERYVPYSSFENGAIDALNASINETYTSVSTTLTGDSVMRGSDGAVTHSVGANYYITDFIPTQQGETFKFSGSMNYGNYYYRFYSINSGNGFGGVKAENDSAMQRLEDEIITVPSGANFIRFGMYTNSNNPYSIEKAVIGITASELTTELLDQIRKEWTGKTWVAIGDSLTENNSTASEKYHYLIAERTGITVINKGKSGTGYGKTYSTSNNFANRVLELADVDCDIITIFGSFNDLSIDLGTADDTGTDTLGGWMNTTFDNLFATKPFVSVGIITPTPWWGRTPASTSETGLKASAYVEMLIEICRKRSIPVLDLFHNSNLHPNDANYREEFFDNADGTHPNNAGHAKIAPMIEQFLKKIIPY